ncbi:MAG: hypothetical protein DHS20C05_10210 [Hyphococcus sp.]|nr:MAG: hypothetical protein DHS20C05_10210 [Marinicaulis sp.]
MKYIKHRLSSVFSVLAIVAALIFSGAWAASATIEQAKDNCIVGEQIDGYLGVVTGANASDDLRREVRDINQKRKAVYADLARRNGVSIQVTAQLTGEKLVNQAGRGECVRDTSGRWIKR